MYCITMSLFEMLLTLHLLLKIIVIILYVFVCVPYLTC